MKNKNVYWASKPISDIGNELLEKIAFYDDKISTYSGFLPLWRASYNQFFSNIFKNGSLTVSGEQSEYTNITNNQYANIALHIKNLATAQKVVWDAKATNSDAVSIKQTIVANSVLDYYARTLKLDAQLRQTLENAILFGEGWIETAWNTSIGELYAITEDDEGNEKQVYSGDVESFVYTPNNVIRDLMKRDGTSDWIILRRKCNRFDLMSQYPAIADIIETVTPENNYQTDLNTWFVDDSSSTDLVDLYTFYHRKTPALPTGRITKFLSGECILFDGALAYDNIPVMRMVATERLDSPLGHTCMFDLLPIQQMVDQLYSSIASNQTTFGVNNILVPAGSNVSATQLDGGLSLISYNGAVGKPEALQLCATPPEIFNHLMTLIGDMERLSGINSVVRGEPPGANVSGVALNLIQQQAVQFSNGLIASYMSCAEDVGTNIINILKSYAKTERIISIVGKNNVINTQEFKAEDISDIQRVTCEVGNPLTKTVAGRVALADQLLEKGLVDAKKYLQVVETGQIDDMLDAPRQQVLLIKSENESMMEGGVPVAIVFDNHMDHIKEHATLLGTTESRNDPELVQRVLNHINEHKVLLETGDPFLLNINNPNVSAAAPAPQGVSIAPQMPDMPIPPAI